MQATGNPKCSKRTRTCLPGGFPGPLLEVSEREIGFCLIVGIVLVPMSDAKIVETGAGVDAESATKTAEQKNTLANETHFGRASWSAIVRLDRCCGECDQLQRGHERVRERPGPGERATHLRLSPLHLQVLGEMR